MKNGKLVMIATAVFFCYSLQSFSANNQERAINIKSTFETDSIKAPADQTNPAWVIEQIFEAAKTGDYTVLNTICDTVADIDGDTKRICAVGTSSDENKKQFSIYFKLGKIVGETVISGNEAKVPITFGPNGDKTETMNLIKRGDNWFLTRF